LSDTLSRRSFLTGNVGPREHHVSSAVVVALPARMEALARELAAMPGIEVHGHNDSRLVIVLEGSTSGELGASLAAISLMEGVISASMVFEQTEELSGEGNTAHPA
jgi:nitrate reductase NapD